MFITRRRFNEEIMKKVQEREEKIYRERELDERFRYIRDDICDLRKRIYELEKELHPDKNDENESPVKCIGF